MLQNSYEIYLRPLKESDISERYLNWFSDKTVTEYLEVYGLKKNECIDYLKLGINTKEYFLFAIVCKEKNLHIGNIKIGSIKRKYAISDLVTVIGDKKYWGKGIATKAILQAKEIAFNIAGLRKLSASIDSLNVNSLKAYQKAGLVIEAKIPRYFMHTKEESIEYSDKIFVGCINSNYKSEFYNLDRLVKIFEEN